MLATLVDSHCPQPLTHSRANERTVQMREAHRDDARRLVEGRAQVVEVLGRETYEEDHLPGAVNISLRRIDAEALDRLDANRPVLVYCWDSA